MMIRYARLKYVLILLVLFLASIYIAPNFFGTLPALQISSTKQSVAVNEATVKATQFILFSKGIAYQDLFLHQNILKIRFKNASEQQKGYQAIHEALGNFYVLTLSRLVNSPVWMHKIGAQPMFLGLDLRGGVHFLLAVDTQAAVRKSMERYAGDIGETLKQENIHPARSLIDQNTAQYFFANLQALDKAHNLIQQTIPHLALIKNADNLSLKCELTLSELNRFKNQIISQNIAILHNRINALGIAEPVVQQAGFDRIIVELPGIQETAKAKDILGRTAILQVRIVESDEWLLSDAKTGNIPSGYDLLNHEEEKLLVSQDIPLTGESISDAQVGFDQNGAPAVHIRLDKNGAAIFRQLTATHIGQRLAMVLIEKNKTEVVTAPVIRSEIGGGQVEISGNMNQAQASDIALLLRSGALAAPMTIIEENVVGPSLGKENIQKGLYATVFGFLAVAIFMGLYYHAFGIISAISLFVNLLILLAILSALQATLTLPGIAAIALALGMAIDSNVLINERIREELRQGITPFFAIKAGYRFAWATIVDSNVTSFIAGAALFSLGSGSIKGFAIVHCLGILTSMFSAVFVSRALVNIWYGHREPLLSISIGQIWRPKT